MGDGRMPASTGNRDRTTRTDTKARHEAKMAEREAKKAAMNEPEGIDVPQIPLVVSRRSYDWALDPMVTDILAGVAGPEKLLKGSVNYGRLTPRHALKILNQLEDRASIYQDSDDRSTINDGKAMARDAAKLRASLTAAGFKLRKKTVYSDWIFA